LVNVTLSLVISFIFISNKLCTTPSTTNSSALFHAADTSAATTSSWTSNGYLLLLLTSYFFLRRASLLSSFRKKEPQRSYFSVFSDKYFGQLLWAWYYAGYCAGQYETMRKFNKK
jgi:hypothetical protein